MKKPSVTELIGLLDKPALMYWSNKIGLQGISLKEYRNKSAKSGVSLHKQIEDYLLNGVLPLDENLLKNIDLFFSDKEVLFVEKSIENEYFVGRIDIGYIQNGIKYLADFKSNQSNLYLENKLQLFAYSMNEPTDRLSIISIPDFKEITINMSQKNDSVEILKSLSKIYSLKKNIEDVW